MRLLAKIMLKLGFHERWVELVMLCISTISYAIHINRVPQGHITPLRGLHQGVLYLLIYFCYVHKVYRPYCTKQRKIKC